MEYRLYAFEAGRILLPDEFDAPDDASAIGIAEQSWTSGRQMELWQNDRRVRMWGPNGPGREPE